VELLFEGRIAVLLYSYWLSCAGLLASTKPKADAHHGHDEGLLLVEESKNRIYFEFFSFPQVNVNLTFTRRDLAEGDDVKHTHANEVSQRITWLAASVDNAPLQLNPLVAKHVFVDIGKLMALLWEHYQRDMMRQFYKVCTLPSCHVTRCQ
jgi:hypothetical protein